MILIEFGRVVLEDLAIYLNLAIDPRLVVFAEQSIAAHEIALDKSVAVHGKLHIAR